MKATKAIYNAEKQSLVVFIDDKPRYGYMGKNSLNKVLMLKSRNIDVLEK